MKMNFKVKNADDPRIRKFLKIVSVVLLVIWAPVILFCFAAGAITMLSPKGLEHRCTEKVDAVVIRYDFDDPFIAENKDGTTTSYPMYQPVFSFALNGQEYTAKSKVCSDKMQFEIGERIVLKVNPDDPTEVFAPGDKSLKKTGWGFIGAGLLMLAVLVGVIVQLLTGKKLSGSVKDGKLTVKS